MAFITPTQEKFIIRRNILLMDLAMKCFESCLINRINSQGETSLFLYFQSVWRPRRMQNITFKHFRCSSKRNLLQRNPIPTSAHRFIMRTKERERNITVE